MRKIKYLFITLFAFFIGMAGVKANTLNDLKIDIYIDNNAKAFVTETWDMTLNEGTEVYKSMLNLGNSEISNFSVKERDTLYTFNSDWDIDASLTSKKNLNGFNYTSNGVELCWGMGSYGNHTYIIKYEVSNFITNTEDAQVLYWQLINPMSSLKLKNFSIRIYGDVAYSDSLDVWGYGYKGYAYVEKGVIKMSNEGTPNSSDYVVLLVKYPLNTFITNNTSKYNTFEEYYNLAENGSYEQDYGNTFSLKRFLGNLVYILFIIGGIFGGARKAYLGLNPGKNYIKNKIDVKTVNNFRDIPCNKNIYLAYFLTQVYDLNKQKGDLLGAIFLKWLKDNQITVMPRKDTLLSKDKVDINLTKAFSGTFDLEKELYGMLETASGDKILEKNELEKWLRTNYSNFLKWFDKVIERERGILISEGKITLAEKKNVFSSQKYIISKELEEEAIKLIGLKKFLEEFSRIDDKKVIEVELWEEYLMFAQIFGIAKKVADQFKKLYPEIVDNPEYQYNYTNIILLNTLSHNTFMAANSARSAAQAYSAGGGGFSSGGGGGGSFGGGGFSGTR